MKILIAGSRNYIDKLKIRRVLSTLPNDTVIIHGDCRGADRLAGNEATALGMTVTAYPAEWGKYGKSAGPRRNEQMLNENTDISRAIIFHEAIEQSLGSKDMIKKLTAKKIPYDLYD